MEEMELNESLSQQTNDLYSGATDFNEYFPISPSDPPTVTNMGVQNYITGSAPGNIPSQVPKTAAYNFDDHKKSMQNYLRGFGQQNAYNPNGYAKIDSYDSGPNGNAFYDRYAATGLNNIDELGFHPTKDNEAVWNDNTSWTSDFSRMISNSFGTLAYEGFVSGPAQLSRWINGDDFFSADREGTRNYERASAIGYSSRGGAGAFASNLVMNFGYTAGIIGEILAEEAVAAVIAPFTGAASTAAVTANAARRLNRIGQIDTSALRVAKGFDFAMDGSRQFTSVLDELNDINAARQTYEGVQKSNKMLRGEAFFSNAFTKSINPLSNTVGEIYDIYRAQDNLAGLASLSKTAGAFYRDVRNINMARSESSLEAGMVQNKVFEELYNKHYAENGVTPDDTEMRNMMNQAKAAGIETSFYNFPIIYATNKVTFSNILSKGRINNYLNQTMKELGEVDAGKFGKMGRVMYNQSTRQFEFWKSGLKNWWKGWRADPIYKSVGKTIGYFKANIAEGLQESYQEVIADAAEKYYVETYDSDLVAKQMYKNGQLPLLNVTGDYFAEGAKKYNPFGTSEGLDIFASGFAMGFLGGGLDKAVNYTFVQANRLTQPEKFKQYKERKLEITRDLINNLNAQGVSGFINSRIWDAGVQSKLSAAKRNGNKKEVEDVENEAFIAHFTTLSENGVLGQYLDGLSSLKGLSDQEFIDAMDNSITVDQISQSKQKITDIVDRAKKLENRYNYYKEKYPNPVDMNLFEKGVSEDYTDAYIMNQAWEYATKQAVFFNESFENTMQRMKDIMDLQYNERPISKMTKRQSDVLFVPKQLSNEIGLLQNEIDALSELKDPASKELLATKKKQLNALTEYKDKFDAFDRYYHRGRYLDGVKQKLSKERGGVEITNEEASSYILEALGVDEATEEKELKLISELETSYKGYLRGIADVEDDYLFTEGVDNAFERLLDYYKLDNESRALAEGVNLLNDPMGYINLVERNKQWMTDLYSRRSEYYEKIVKSQLEQMENNALLNALADKGVFVSVDDFKKWMDFRIPPKEFYDQARGIVIPEGSPTYEEYYALFDRLAEAAEDKSTEIVQETMDTALKNELDRLDREKQAKINSLPKTTVREDLDEVLPNRGTTMGIRRIAGQIPIGNYADATYMDQDVEETLTFYKDSNGNLFYVVDGNITNQVESNLAYKFTKAQVYNFSEKPDQVIVDEIEKDYEELKNRVKERYANAKQSLKEEGEKEKIYTPDTDLDEMPNDLKKELYDLFKKEELDNLPEEVRVNMKYNQEQNLFVKFIQSSLSAKDVLDKYNKKQKVTKATAPTGEKNDFTFKFLGKEVNTKDLTAVELRSYQRRLKQTIIGLTEKQRDNTITPEEKTELANAKVVSVDIEKLIKTRSKNELSPELQEAVKKVEDIETKQEDILTTELGVVVDGVVHRPVTKVNVDTTEGTEESTANESIAFVNEQLDNLFTKDVTPTFDQTKISREAFDSLFGENGIFTTLKKREENGEIYITSRNLKVYDTDLKLAGQIDLLVADTKKNLTIVKVDLRTKEQWNAFDKKNNDQLLPQTLNANLLQRMTGVTPKVALMPIEIVADKSGKITSAAKPSRENLLDTEFLITLDKNLVKDQAEGIVPAVKPVPEVQPTVQMPINAKSSDDQQSPAKDAEGDEVDPEMAYKPANERITANDIAEKLKSVTTEPQLLKLKIQVNLDIAEGKILPEDIDKITEMLDNKDITLSEEIDPKISPDNMVKGTQLVAKSLIFTDKNQTEIFAEEDDTVVITSTNKKEGTVTIQPLGKKTRLKLTRDELNNLFSEKEAVMEAKEKPTTKPDKESKANVVETLDAVDTFVADQDALSEIEKQAEKKSLKDLDNDLLDDTDC